MNVLSILDLQYEIAKRLNPKTIFKMYVIGGLSNEVFKILMNSEDDNSIRYYFHKNKIPLIYYNGVIDSYLDLEYDKNIFDLVKQYPGKKDISGYNIRNKKYISLVSYYQDEPIYALVGKQKISDILYFDVRDIPRFN